MFNTPTPKKFSYTGQIKERPDILIGMCKTFQKETTEDERKELHLKMDEVLKYIEQYMEYRWNRLE